MKTFALLFVGMAMCLLACGGSDPAGSATGAQLDTVRRNCFHNTLAPELAGMPKSKRLQMVEDCLSCGTDRTCFDDMITSEMGSMPKAHRVTVIHDLVGCAS